MFFCLKGQCSPARSRHPPPPPLPPKNQREMKIAVIENEYGAVSIDTALVEENVREVGWLGWGGLRWL